MIWYDMRWDEVEWDDTVYVCMEVLVYLSFTLLPSPSSCMNCTLPLAIPKLPKKWDRKVQALTREPALKLSWDRLPPHSSGKLGRMLSFFFFMSELMWKLMLIFLSCCCESLCCEVVVVFKWSWLRLEHCRGKRRLGMTCRRGEGRRVSPDPR